MIFSRGQVLNDRGRALRTLPWVVGLLVSACGDDGGRAEESSGFSGGPPQVTTASMTTLPAGTTDAEPAPTTSEGAGASTGGGTGGSTGDGSTGGGSTGGGAEPGSEPGEGPDGGAKFDLGGAPEPGDGGQTESACVKIDLLFVIDNSGSMKQEQANLIASFPAFVEEMQQELVDAESLHIGVVSTDEYEGNEAPCADKLGALVTRTGGDGSSNAKCGPYANGRRFMTEMDDLPQRFTCAGQVGIDGSGDEKPIDATLQALGPGLAGPGGCNEDFARDDALLVLVLITDEEDSDSIGDPPQWFNSLVALRGGVETNIVVLSLIGPKNPACKDALEVGERLIEFTEMFTYGSVGQICAGTYKTFFHDAVAGIAEACGQFMPPG